MIPGNKVWYTLVFLKASFFLGFLVWQALSPKCRRECLCGSTHLNALFDDGVDVCVEFI